MQPETIALVEDDHDLRRVMTKSLRREGFGVVESSTFAGGIRALEEGVDILVTDVRLPDGSGVNLVRDAMHRVPPPIVVAFSGAASPPEAFDLATAGVAIFLQKPFTTARLVEAIEQARAQAKHIGRAARRQVGRSSLRSVQKKVRREMVDEAMGRAGGNRRRAAEILGVTRQAVQRILREE